MALTKIDVSMTTSGANQKFAPGVPIIENTQTVTANVAIASGSNAMSAGPMSIADGVTVTIPDGSFWSIV